MIVIVILVIAALIAAGGLAMLILGKRRDPDVRRHDDEIPTRAIGAGVLGFALLFILVFTGLQSFKVIGANEVAVPVTFGRAAAPIGSGPTLVAPWTDVVKYPTRPQTVTTVANIRTGESGKAAVRISGRWAVDRSKATELFLQRRNDDQHAIETQLIEPNIQAAAGAFYGNLSNLDAINGSQWETNADGVETKLAVYLARYGITVDSLQIREVNPDDNTDAAIARVAAQQRETAVAKESNATAAAQAQQQKTAALGLKTAADQVSNLTPAEVQALCLQAAERIMNKNNEKGLPTYVLPCQTSSASVLAK